MWAPFCFITWLSTNCETDKDLYSKHWVTQTALFASVCPYAATDEWPFSQTNRILDLLGKQGWKFAFLWFSYLFRSTPSRAAEHTSLLSARMPTVVGTLSTIVSMNTSIDEKTQAHVVQSSFPQRKRLMAHMFGSGFFKCGMKNEFYCWLWFLSQMVCTVSNFILWIKIPTERGRVRIAQGDQSDSDTLGDLLFVLHTHFPFGLCCF